MILGSLKMKTLCYRLLGLLGLLFALDFLGVFLILMEEDFHAGFADYPIKGDIDVHVEELRQGLPVTAEFYFKDQHDYKFQMGGNPSKCYPQVGEDQPDEAEEGSSGSSSLRLVYVVKSAVGNFRRREAIRKTWGFERRFSDVAIRTVFLIGVPDDSDAKSDEVKAGLFQEQSNHGDLVQGDFVDHYYSNVVKTLMGLRWVHHYCNNSRFYLLVDDDYYVSTRNILRFLRNPTNYPAYLEEPVLTFDGGRKLQQMVDFDLPQDVLLYSGWVVTSKPFRQKFSKWFVPLETYPYHLYPPYVTGGAIVLSKMAASKLYLASYFVKRFPLDDVYLGIVAKKCGLEPFDAADQFWMYRKEPYRVKDYRYLVASHDYGDPEEMTRVWNEQKQAGNA